MIGVETRPQGDSKNKARRIAKMLVSLIKQQKKLEW